MTQKKCPRVNVLALRISAKEVEPEDYGIPAKYDIGLFQVIAKPTGNLLDEAPSTVEGIDKLKKHLLKPRNS